MRDDDHRPGGERRQQCCVQTLFGEHIDRRRRFVQDDDLWIGQQHPGDRETLSLPSGQSHASIAEDRIEPLLQGRNRPVELGDVQGPPEILVRALATEGEIRANAVIQE